MPPITPDYYLQTGLQDLGDFVQAIEHFPIPPMQDQQVREFILGQLTNIRDRAANMLIELDPNAHPLTAVVHGR